MISRPLPNCCARKSLDFKVYQVCCMGLDGWGECFRGRLRHCSRWWLLLFGVCFRGVKSNQNSCQIYIYICSSQALKNGRTSRLAIPLGPFPPFSFPWLSWSVKFQKKTDLCSFQPPRLTQSFASRRNDWEGWKDGSCVEMRIDRLFLYIDPRT